MNHGRPTSVRRRIAASAAVLLLAACASPSASPSTGSLEPEPSTSAPSASAAPSTTVAPPSGASEAPTPALAWAPLDTDGPAAREDHTWTVDREGRIAYLFGGRDGGTAFDDLWAYDLETDAWAELAPASAPPARFGHEAAWIDGIGLVVFAGQAGTTFFNDLWAYDPSADAWSQLPSGGDVPVARYGSCSAVGDDGRLWISHGFTSDGVRFSDTRAYDFASGTWWDETPSGERPVERCLHACWLTDAGELSLYAGQTTGVVALGDLWTLGTDGWTPSTGTLPAERNLPAHVRLDGATLIFGGMALDGGFHADAWLLADAGGGATELAPSGDAPAGRSAASLVRDPARDRVLLFGGRTTDGASDETWALTGITEP
jgi:hypothetical protein